MNYGPASKFYDLFSSKDDIHFYKELALANGRKALDLGVGTGRVAIPLARAGVTVKGIDNSIHMLKVATTKLEGESSPVRKRVNLELGDMLDFRSEDSFPFIYMASSTFEHCVTEEDQRRCLKSICSALDRDGVFAFDISQPASSKNGHSFWVEAKEQEDDKEVVRTIFSNRNPDTNITYIHLFFEVYHMGRMIERYHEHGKARISSKEEIEKLLADFNLDVSNVFGDFKKSFLSVESKKIIFVSRKL